LSPNIKKSKNSWPLLFSYFLVYIYTYIYTHIYIYIYTHTHTHIYIYSALQGTQYYVGQYYTPKFRSLNRSVILLVKKDEINKFIKLLYLFEIHINGCQRYLYLRTCYLIIFIRVEVLLLLSETKLQDPQNIVFHLIHIHIFVLKSMCLFANAHYSPLLSHKYKKRNNLLVLQLQYNFQHNSIIVS